MNATTLSSPTAPAPRHPLRALLAAAALAVVGIGCAAPATVEGVFANEAFALVSESPLSKPTGSGRDRVVVLSQVDSETLSTVSIVIPDLEDVALGEALAVGTGAWSDRRPSLEAAVGDLLVETRSDGVELISAENATIATSVGGTFTLDERSAETLAGSFRVDLDDGGYLEGAFVATAVR